MQKNKKSNDLFLAYLGESLRQRRIELLLSQEQLAVLAKLHRTYVTEVENGLRNISMTTLLKITKALKSNPSLHMKEAEKAVNGPNGSKEKS